MWEKIKSWIIHKFGGKTQEEYDGKVPDPSIKIVYKYPKIITLHSKIEAPCNTMELDNTLFESEQNEFMKKLMIEELVNKILESNGVKFNCQIDYLTFKKVLQAEIKICVEE